MRLLTGLKYAYALISILFITFALSASSSSSSSSSSSAASTIKFKVITNSNRHADGVYEVTTKTEKDPKGDEVIVFEYKKLAEAPSKFEDLSYGILAFYQTGVYLFREGVDHTIPIAPANPDNYEINQDQNSAVFFYDWLNNSPPDHSFIEGDLYLTDLKGIAKRIFAKPIQAKPTHDGSWVVYAEGMNFNLSFFDFAGNEKVCHRGLLTRLHRKTTELDLQEYKAIVSTLELSKGYGAPSCRERENEKIFAELSGENKRVLENGYDGQPYGENWTEMARKGLLPEIFGDEAEERVDILFKNMSNNSKKSTIILGPAGVGKTASVIHMANRLAKGRVPEKFKDWELYSIAASSLGSEGLADLAAKKARELIRNTTRKKVILLIDEIHQLIGIGAADGKPFDITEVFKTELANGDLVIIGTTTPHGNEYSALRNKKAFYDRFWEMHVSEPSTPTLMHVFGMKAEKYEQTHRVKFTSKLLKELIRLSNQYQAHKFHPRKGLGIMEALATHHRSEEPEPIVTIPLQSLCKHLTEQSGRAVACFRNAEGGLLEKVRGFIPAIDKKVIGQDEAKKSMKKTMVKVAFNMHQKNKPSGQWLFLGPSGVGKTYLAKKFSEYFQGKGMYTKFNMGDFQQEHSIASLVGAPAGYIGSDKPGKLYSWTLKAPTSTMIFDEVDKAHPRVLDALLPLMDEGEVQDLNKSERPESLDFTSGYLVFTSNWGLRIIEAHDFKESGASETDPTCKDIGVYIELPTQYLKDSMCKLSERDLKEFILNFLMNKDDKFGTYFGGRIGLSNIIIFHHLKGDELAKIAKLKVDDVVRDVKAQGFDLVYDPAIPEWIVKSGYKKEFGARSIEDQVSSRIRNLIPEKLNDLLEKGEFPSAFKITIENGRPVVYSDTEKEYETLKL